MKINLANILKTYPLFVFLLPLFFVLHGYNVFYPLIPASDLLLLTCLYLAGAILLFFLFWLIYKKWNKAAILAFVLQSFNFFFGPVHDFLKGSFFGRYSFLLPFILILSIIIFLVLRKTTHRFIKVTQYLNLLLILLCIIDIISILSKSSFSKPTALPDDNTLTICQDCPKPDIYYIIADEYGGLSQLKSLFNFDNIGFENELRKRGFHIIENSKSNYNYTIFSAPSILNMDYLSGIEGINRSVKDKRLTSEIMKNNRVVRFLKRQGYEIFNHSIFDLDGLPAQNHGSILPAPTRPLQSQTLLYRLQKDLWYHLVTTLKISAAEKALIYQDKRNNELFIELTSKTAKVETNKPKFVYTHLMMPHYPYYYNKDGKETSYEFLHDEYAADGTRYTSYIQYCNTLFLQFIDELKSASRKPPIIIFMSDHGFKSFKNNANDSSSFFNLNAVFLPDSSYAGFYKGMSNVNQFRVLLNTEFRQKLPMLKDSVSFITE